MKATGSRNQTDGAGECSQELWRAVSFSQLWLASHVQVSCYDAEVSKRTPLLLQLPAVQKLLPSLLIHSVTRMPLPRFQALVCRVDMECKTRCCLPTTSNPQKS